jgi:beta-lactamase regulating signal transducer with metallopeptidase domain
VTGTAAQWVADRLTAGSIEGAVVVAVVWAVCRFVSGIPASVQSMLWWLAALKLVLVLLPVPAIPIPLLPASDGAPGIVPPPSIAMTAGTNARERAVGRAAGTEMSARASTQGRWLDAVVAVWLAIVLVQAVRLRWAHRRLRGIVRRAMPCSTEESAAVAALAARIGLHCAFEVRMSVDIETPQVVGCWRPVVLLPARAFTADERSMMLCHELMHVRRRDLAFGWIPAAAERLFFFHPLARLAAREYFLARESACDAAVVRALDVSPVDYARMLVRFGVAAGEPALTAGGSPASFSSLKRRLEMLHHDPSSGSSRSTWLLAAAVCALIPLQLAARTPAPQAAAGSAAPVATESASAAAPVEAVRQSAPPAPASPAAALAPPREAAPATAPAPTEQSPTQRMAAAMQELAESTRQRADELRQRAAGAERALEARQDIDERASRANEMRNRMEEYHRALAELNARFESQNGRDALAMAAEQLARQMRARQLDDLARRDDTAAVLEQQLQQLARQQEILVEQLKQIAEQQRELSAVQRRLSEETERIRRQLEAK